MKTLAILVGTGLWKGLSRLPLQEKVAHRDCVGYQNTTILYYETGYYGNLKVVLLPRHGTNMGAPQRSPAALVQSKVHEAHMWLLSELCVDEIYAFNTVGSLDPHLPLADTNTFVIPDQMGYGLGVPIHSFCERAKYPHPEMSQIFSEPLRNKLNQALTQAGAKTIQTGTYIYSNVDHLETAVEGRALREIYKEAKHPVVGSTAGAEAVLAREMGLKYAMCASVSNYVQGISKKEVEHGEILRVMDKASQTLVQVVQNVCEINLEEICLC
jgi:purine nucleoside phosphorylase